MKALYIRGCFDSILGYGAHMRSHLRLLEKAGIEFRILYVASDPNILLTNEARRFHQKVVAEPPPEASVVIQFGEACYLKFYPGCTHIAYTMWEQEGLPKSLSGNFLELEWVSHFNRCDRVWTGSQFSKQCFENAGVKVPISVVPWALEEKMSSGTSMKISAIQLPTWTPNNSHEKSRDKAIRLMQEMGSLGRALVSLGYFCFSVLNFAREWSRAFMLWTSSPRTVIQSDSRTFMFVCMNTFLERKNFADLFSAYLNAFRQTDNVRLVIKTHRIVSSAWMRIWILKDILKILDDLKVEDAPPIYLILDPLNDSETAALFEESDSFVNASKGEGVGGGVLQSMLAGKPPVTHTFSSMKDFCNETNSFLYDYSLEPVRASGVFYGMRQRWARPNMENFIEALQKAYENWRDHLVEFRTRGKAAQEAAKRYGSSASIVSEYRSVIS